MTNIGYPLLRGYSVMNHFEIPLDIEDVKIERVEFKENSEIIII